ncbi:MAG TPA: pantoate--beta-alanine ligase [Acidimicrobiia bacterium]|jgi:pantoate--beta-alanine ligase
MGLERKVPDLQVETVLVTHIADLRDRLETARRQGAHNTVGFVPTMGAFHEGHRSLMRAARTRHEFVVVSLFVNPLQFGPGEDLDRYPRDLDGDLAVAGYEGVDLVYAPSVAEMYPDGAPLTTVHVDRLGDGLCGAGRPGHFDGVATVVAKLFALVGPATAYFGRKDAQQLAVVRRMAADLCLPVEVVGCPLVREADGLALSSRNRNLDPAERAAATVLFRALTSGADLVVGGERDACRLRRVVANVATTEELVRLEYAEVVDAGSMEPLEVLQPGVRGGPEGHDVLVAVAARVGEVRLIDNVTLRIDAAGASVDLGVTVAPSPPGARGVPEGIGEATCAAG